MYPGRLEATGHLLQHCLEDLRGAAFMDSEHLADSFHGDLVVIVETKHLPFPLRKRSDRLVKRLVQLLTGTKAFWLSLSPVRKLPLRHVFWIGGTWRHR